MSTTLDLFPILGYLRDMFKSLGTRGVLIGTYGINFIRRIIRLHELVIISYGGYYRIYGPRVPSPTIYLAYQWRMIEEEACEY